MVERLREYSEYLGEQARVAYAIVWDRASLIFLPIWHVLVDRFHGFWFTAPLFWLGVFWTIDFVLGSGRAIVAGEWRAQRERQRNEAAKLVEMMGG
jgi:hypothetical protein